MSILDHQQLENTRNKLQTLEQLYDRVRQQPTENDHARELTLRSLKQLINQFKEEIVRFEVGVGSTANGTEPLG